MPASATPPSFALKNLIWVGLGLPSMIVQATIVPSRGAMTRLWMLPTFTWKPVVRLTARQGVAGQLGTVAGFVVGGITPTSLRVAEEPAGRTSASVNAARIGAHIALIWGIQHDQRADVAVGLLRYFPASSCAAAAISSGSPGAGTHGRRSGSPS